MTPERLKSLLEGEPGYRVKQAARAIYRDGVGDFGEITTLPLPLRKRLSGERILSLEVETVKVSKDGRAHKAVLRLADGKRIESVLLNPKPDLWSACISSQVGCALACSFCATGLMGFTRNLTAEEITDQVLFWRQYIRGKARHEGASAPGRLENIVYMGMGEPLLNLENVFLSLRRLSDPDLFGIGQRHLSVSTAGIAPGIEKFGAEFGQVNLALSLHAGSDPLREKLVPIHRAYGFEKLRTALKKYFAKNKRKVFIEYVLLEGENDREEDARAVVDFLASVGPKQLLHVNLIVWNPTDTSHSPTRPEEARRFADAIRAGGFTVTIRKNLGLDIEGACGQLVISK